MMNPQSPPVILVTGAGGFIGAELVKKLRTRDFNVKTMVRSSVPGEKHFQWDLTSGQCPVDMFEGVHTLFHLAGKAHAVAETLAEQADYRQVNIDGTRKLLEAAKQAGVKCFVFFSSVKAVGDGEYQPIDEKVTIPATTCYGQSKYEAEQLVLHGGYVPYPVVIRPAMVYGNSNKGNLPRMIKAIKAGLFPPVPELHNRRSMVHVEDVVRAAILAAEKPEAKGQIYIVTDGQSYSTRQIYDWIREGLGKTPVCWAIPLVFLKALAKIGDTIGLLRRRRFLFDSITLKKLTGSAWYCSAKIERELGFTPRYTLPQSLPDILRFLNLK